MARSAVLGIDIGTQSLRAAAFDLDGVCLAHASVPIDTHHPRPAWAEQDVESWWSAAKVAVPKALGQSRLDPKDIVAIGLDSTACTVVACQLDSTPLRPALLWMDQRAYLEAEELSATRDPSLRYVSGVVSPEWMLPKARWLKRHEEKTYARADRIVECTDWFMYRLTGRWTLSLNHVAVKWNYAKPDGGWSAALLRAVGLEDIQEKWPTEIVPLGGGEGTLSSQAAATLGLTAGIPVAQGGIDAYLGMIGLGAVNDGDLAMIMGSSTCHLAQSREGVFGSGLLGCYPDATVPGLYSLEGGQTATGSVVDWFRRHFAGNEQKEADQTGRHVFDVLDEKASKVPGGSEGLICLDYFQGNRCPLKDPRARGAFWGLTLAHHSGHLLRSIYEATALGTRHLLEDAIAHGFDIRRISVGGGGVRSHLWLQIHADVLQRPLRVPTESESCALGAALMAAVHAKRFESLEHAARAMVKFRTVLEPDPSQRALYDDLFQTYLETYRALKPLMHQQSAKLKV